MISVHQDHFYSADCTFRQRITVSNLASDWHSLMVVYYVQPITMPSFPSLTNNFSRGTASSVTVAQSPTLDLHPVQTELNVPRDYRPLRRQFSKPITRQVLAGLQLTAQKHQQTLKDTTNTAYTQIRRTCIQSRCSAALEWTSSWHQEVKTLATFKKHLKTFLFCKHYGLVLEQ